MRTAVMARISDNSIATTQIASDADADEAEADEATLPDSGADPFAPADAADAETALEFKFEFAETEEFDEGTALLDCGCNEVCLSMGRGSGINRLVLASFSIVAHRSKHSTTCNGNETKLSRNEEAELADQSHNSTENSTE